MVDLNQLEQLLAFEKYGTVSKAAEELLISQPALTRSLQRLEENLDIPLFARSKNKMSLTETGSYTAKQARQLLEKSQEFLEDIRHQADKLSTLYIGVCAPGAILELTDRMEEIGQEKQLNFKQKNGDELLQGLLDETYQIIITDGPLEQEGVSSYIFVKEQLYLSLPPAHPLALKQELELSDLDNLTMLLFSDLGAWDKVVDLLTKTTFIRQNDMETFNSLITASALPNFTTNLTQIYGIDPENNRVDLPFTDEEATITFYINVLKENENLLEQIV